jgi:hypothetical protein
MTKCIGCKREFNHQGFPSHKKFCKAYKREIRTRLSNIPKNVPVGPVPGTFDEAIEINTQAGELAEIPQAVDEVQVTCLVIKTIEN